VYERAGGHAYGSVYPGPIGAILSPQLRGIQSEIDASLPYASSLCGACYEVCPVAIDIPEVLVHLREKVADQGGKGHRLEKAAIKAAGWVLDHPAAFAAGERIASKTRKLHPKKLPGAGAWTASRELPEMPAESFRDWWKKNRT
jgi:L-lactate dehydrogenase complex protein LldF